MRGIVANPKYISTLFSYQKELEKYERKFSAAKYASVRGKVEQYLEKLRRTLEKADGHVKALESINDKCGFEIFNIGTGQGYSVLDVVKSFEKANNIKIPYIIKPRREGDIAECYSDPSKAEKMLG